MLPMAFTFSIFLIFSVVPLGNCLIDIQLSPTITQLKICTHYCSIEGTCFPVWRSNGNLSEFFVFPQLQVIPLSVKVRNYPIIRRHQISFKVKLYDNCFLQAVAKHVTEKERRRIDSAHVHILPLQDMQLVWANDDPIVETIWLPRYPKPQTMLTQTASFHIFAQSAKAASELFETINDNPGFLQELLEVQYAESNGDTKKYKRARLQSPINDTCESRRETTCLSEPPSKHQRTAKMVLIGGQSTNSAEIYVPNDISQNKELSGLNVSRKAAVSGFFDGNLLTAGGFHWRKQLKSTEFYDFQNNKWKKGPNMKYSHSWGSACTTDDRLIVCGGVNQNYNVSRNCEFLKSNSTEWRITETMPYLVKMHSCAVVDNILYVIGGSGGLTEDYIAAIRSVQRYNPISDTWSFAASFSKLRISAASAVLGNEIIVCGGAPSRKGSVYYNDCEKSNRAVDQWMPMEARMNRPRVAFVLLSCNNQLYAFGGLNFDGAHHDPPPQKEIEIYNPEKNVWSFSNNSLIVSRSSFTGTVFY